MLIESFHDKASPAMQLRDRDLHEEDTRISIENTTKAHLNWGKYGVFTNFDRIIP
jgi:hypothetical protein